MRRSPVLFALERHYRDHWGELRKIEAEIVNSGFVGDALRRRMGPQIATLKAALTHIEFCLQLFEPDWRRDRVQPKKPRKPGNPDKWGRLLNMAYDVLRDSLATPLTTVEIIDELWKRGRIRSRERDESRSRLTTLLRGQERLGAVRSHGVRPLAWSIIRSPPRDGDRTGLGGCDAPRPLSATAASSQPTAERSALG